jgi:hypothetical protein
MKAKKIFFIWEKIFAGEGLTEDVESGGRNWSKIISI